MRVARFKHLSHTFLFQRRHYSLIPFGSGNNSNGNNSASSFIKKLTNTNSTNSTHSTHNASNNNESTKDSVLTQIDNNSQKPWVDPALKNDKYLYNYLSRVSYTTAAGLFGTSATSAAVITLFPVSDMITSLPLFFGSAAAMLASAFAISSIKPKFGFAKSNELNSAKGTTDEIVLINQPERIAAMGTLSISSGIMLAPMLEMMHSIDPVIIPAAACITSFTMIGMIHYALNTPRSLIGYGPALHIGLWGLIGNGVIGLILFPNQFSFFVDVFGGIGLFMGLTAYDTQCAIRAYQNKKPDHIKFAAEFYLNFLNLFIRIMEALAAAAKK